MTLPSTLPTPDRAFIRFGATDRLTHLPALDGLRGLAVVAVVLFHGNWSFAKGGFLGVSLFFTLSGFLITSLLVSEHRHTGAIDLRGFWVRRFRRLLPAAWLTLAVVTLLGLVVEFGGLERVDVWASFLNIANWRFMTSGDSYAALFAEPSPVRHFWSLAIEEQCYVVVPLVIVAVMHSAKRKLNTLLAVLCGLLGLSIAATLLADGADRVYYGTDTRAAEVLVGAILAVIVANPDVRRRLALGFWPRLATEVAGGLALLATAIAWVSIEVTDASVSNGGLVVTAVISSVLVLNAALGTGPVATFLRVEPLQALGRISYGVYLFHWPLFLLLSERRTGLSQGPRFLLAVAITLVLASISHRRFELPMRRGGVRVAGLSMSRLAPIVGVSLLGATLTFGGAASADSGFDPEAATASLAQASRRARAEAGAQAVVAGVVQERSGLVPSAAVPPTFAFFGDSVALSIAYPLGKWSVETSDALYLGGDTPLGCGIGRYGRQKAFGVVTRTDECNGWPERWAAFVDQHGPQIAVVQSAQWEIVPRQLAGDSVWRTIGDPVYDRYLRDEFIAAVDTLSREGTLVIWVNQPYYGQMEEVGLTQPMRESHADERVDRLNAIIGEVARARPDTMRILDLAGWMRDKTDDVSLRADGSHFNKLGSEPLAEFFGPTMVETWRTWLETSPTASR